MTLADETNVKLVVKGWLEDSKKDWEHYSPNTLEAQQDTYTAEQAREDEQDPDYNI